MSQEELAKLAGYSERSIVARIESGEIDLSQSKIKAFADIFHVTPSALMGDDDQDVLIAVKIPLYSPICCGNGGFNDDNIIDYITLPSDMLNPRGDYFAQRAAGDSMIGEGIKPGDLLVFEKTGHCENGQIGCFCIDDNDAVCKKYRVTENNQIMLLPANDKYDPMIIDVENEHFRCIGVLAYLVHSYK
jgi:repressor LexA